CPPRTARISRTLWAFRVAKISNRLGIWRGISCTKRCKAQWRTKPIGRRARIATILGRYAGPTRPPPSAGSVGSTFRHLDRHRVEAGVPGAVNKEGRGGVVAGQHAGGRSAVAGRGEGNDGARI